MTRERFWNRLGAIGWTGGQLARELQRDERTVRRWGNGSLLIPADVVAWVEWIAALHEANPFPGGTGS